MRVKLSLLLEVITMTLTDELVQAQMVKLQNRRELQEDIADISRILKKISAELERLAQNSAE